MVMEAYDDPGLRKLVNEADLVVPDGMPLAWALRFLGIRRQQRISGPDLMQVICQLAEKQGIPVGFYGARPEVLDALVLQLQRLYPSMSIAYAVSPPFRPMDEAERAEVIDAIRASDARILFVGLGCPRQERWMAEHRGHFPAVMLGVGAAFDFHAGSLRRAPQWMQRAGLEWIFRLAQEPRRLFWRYLKHNPRFLCLFVFQLFRHFTRTTKPIEDGPEVP
jgi:N-acetylglucosaminyldiphosphoundecaprenol N-acetyl-beta-D-mannosaminyltransferase